MGPHARTSSSTNTPLVVSKRRCDLAGAARCHSGSVGSSRMAAELRGVSTLLTVWSAVIPLVAVLVAQPRARNVARTSGAIMNEWRLGIVIMYAWPQRPPNPRGPSLERCDYAASAAPNHLVNASTSPLWDRSPTHATYPSGRINTAVGAGTTPSAGSSHVPWYSASIDCTRSAHGAISKSPDSPSS